jgi:pimeloyl-ACP methyl ester carboxylesterase
MGSKRVVVALLSAAMTVSGCSDSSSDPSSTVASSTASSASASASASAPDPDTATIAWGACDDPKATDEVLECGTLVVPLDYEDPDGDTIDLALVKVPAGDDRQGAILFNPGGPGGSGFDYVAQGGTIVSAALGAADFDLIGFDPRGVDRSAGIRCLTDAEQDAIAYLDDTPDTPAEQSALDDADAAFATACTAKYGDTLQHFSTDNTARDMDAIRKALGDDRISYLGISYGTYLGAVYATMYPDNVRAMVLDSAFEPGGDTLEQQYTTQLVGFEGAFGDWARWCDENDACGFGNGDAAAAWDALVQSLDDAPVANADGRSGNQVVLRRATIAALYSKAEWPALGAALAAAERGDPSGLFGLADEYNGRSPDGTYTTIQQSNTVINCASGIEQETPPDPEALAAELRELAPRFAKSVDASDLDGEHGCADLMPKQPLDELSFRGDAPIVVVGGTNDPATPFRWAEEMAAALGETASLVTYTGEGHGQLLASSCVTTIEAALLVDEQRPDDGTVCDPDPEIEKPEWWDAIPLPEGIDPVLESSELTGALGLAPTQVYAELHTTALAEDDVLATYTTVLEDGGFGLLGEEEPLPGAQQAVFTAPGGDLFSVLVLGAEAFASDDLASVASAVPVGKVLVVLLTLPQ